MKCTVCSSELPDDATFCPYCGARTLTQPEVPIYQNTEQTGILSDNNANTVVNDQTDDKRRKGAVPILPIVVIAVSTIVIAVSLIAMMRMGIIKIGFGSQGGDNPQTASTSSVTPPAENSNSGQTAAPTETPVPSPTETPVPTPTSTPMPTFTPTPTPMPTFTPTPVPEVVIPEVITIYGGIQATASDFLFPESSSEYLTTARMNQVMESSDANMMHKLSQLAINEILARYGYRFTSSSQTAQDARDQFENKGWYQSVRQICPSNQWDVLRANYMNSYERANFDALNQWQKDHGVYY